LIIGIISIVLFPIISLQSCAAGISNALSDSTEISGSAGFVTAVFLLVAGIVMVVSRKTEGKGAPITCCVFYWACFFFSRMFSGTYSDLRIWGGLAFFFGAFSLVSCMKSKKGLLISLGISLVYFILGLI
jgi:hypothetical protein